MVQLCIMKPFQPPTGYPYCKGLDHDGWTSAEGRRKVASEPPHFPSWFRGTFFGPYLQHNMQPGLPGENNFKYFQLELQINLGKATDLKFNAYMRDACDVKKVHYDVRKCSTVRYLGLTFQLVHFSIWKILSYWLIISSMDYFAAYSTCTVRRWWDWSLVLCSDKPCWFAGRGFGLNAAGWPNRSYIHSQKNCNITPPSINLIWILSFHFCTIYYIIFVYLLTCCL